VPLPRPSPGNDQKGNQVLQIGDFTAGIVTSGNGAYGAPFQRANPQKVSASQNTWGVIASPSGGLTPLPQASVWDLPTNGGAPTNYYNATSGYPQQFCGGIIGCATGSRSIVMALKQGYTATRGSLWQYSGNPIGGTWAELMTDNGSTFSGPNVGWVSGMLPFSTYWANDASLAGPYSQDELVLATTKFLYHRQFPFEEGSSTETLAYDISAGTNFFMAVGREGFGFPHQTRTGFWEAEGNAIYNVLSYVNPELSDWSTPANPDFGTQQLVFQSNHPSPVGAFGSLTNGDLLVVTQDSGGYIISGDFSDPYPTQAPGVMSTGGLIGQTTLASPLGLIYGTADNGMWVWDGGALSTKISAQLDDDFFFSQRGPDAVAQGATFPQGYWYSTYQYGNWILVSNNWLYDIVTQSWWTLKEPDDYPFMYYCEYPGSADSSVSGRADFLFACPGVFNNLNTAVGGRFQKSLPASNWQWQSNTISMDDGYLTNVKQIALLASGEGTITVSLGPPDNPSLFSYEVPVPASALTGPASIRFPCDVRVDWLVVTLNATSSGSFLTPLCVQSLDIWYQTTGPVTSS
jgi:hypothetical protein